MDKKLDTQDNAIVGREQFMPLNIRRVFYVLAIGVLAAAPLLAVTHVEYANAMIVSGNLFGAVALGTALANPTQHKYEE